MKTLLFGSTLLCLLASPAHAQLRKVDDLSLPAANKLADAAMAACLAQGRHIVVTVLDHGGNVVTVQRADGVGPHNTEASRRKAIRRCPPRAIPMRWPWRPATIRT